MPNSLQPKDDLDLLSGFSTSAGDDFWRRLFHFSIRAILLGVFLAFVPLVHVSAQAKNQVDTSAKVPSFQLLRTGDLRWMRALLQNRGCTSFQTAAPDGQLLTCTAFHCLHELGARLVGVYNRARVLVPGIPHNWTGSFSLAASRFQQLPNSDISCTTEVPSFGPTMRIAPKVPAPGASAYIVGYPKSVGPELATCTYLGRRVFAGVTEIGGVRIKFPSRILGVLDCHSEVAHGYSGSAVYTDDGVIGVLSGGGRIGNRNVELMELVAEYPLAAGRANLHETFDDFLFVQDEISKARVKYGAAGLLEYIDSIYTNGSRHRLVFSQDAMTYEFESYDSAGVRH